ncbi:MAG TPA: hypothetical protein ENH55_13215 [Aurantimonas coralicida]|uniref:Uncharacterized protein n=2 Tax=root TaxID=1 RepID=A0A9C9NDV6_9HYPH|nr:hypothetical protein [Aurantimonas coralicida]HET99680.1 hypothetical protein [Aurantimonas coralicida]
MADTAFQRQYRQEFIAAFEDRQTILRATCVQEAVISGNEAVFLVAGSGSASAVTRGVNGLIPARADALDQNTATLREYHDLVRKTNFNIFASQGDQRRIMQMTSMSVINRQIDDLIIAQLDTSTNNTGTAAIASLDVVVWAMTILGNNFVDITDEDNLYALVSPAFHGYMMQVPEYASADYVEVKPFTGPARRFRRWAGFNWMVHPRLTNSVGAGGSGSSEQCFFYHRDAIGCAIDRDGIDMAVGYDEEQAYSYARESIHMGAVLLQNSGVVQALHDASGYAAT